MQIVRRYCARTRRRHKSSRSHRALHGGEGVASEQNENNLGMKCIVSCPSFREKAQRSGSKQNPFSCIESSLIDFPLRLLKLYNKYCVQRLSLCAACTKDDDHRFFSQRIYSSPIVIKFSENNGYNNQLITIRALFVRST